MHPSPSSLHRLLTVQIYCLEIYKSASGSVIVDCWTDKTSSKTSETVF